MRPLDEVRRILVQQWLDKARQDPSAAEMLLTGRFLPYPSCFYSQQAVEFRYPGEFDEPTKEETERALDLARKTGDVILTRLENFSDGSKGLEP